MLNISVSLADLQLSQTSAHITPRMGYAGMDAYADAQDDCHSMTAAFARWILQTDPSPAKVAALAANGRLAKYGISPAELDPEKLRAELAKVDVAAVAGIPARRGRLEAPTPGTPAAAPRTGARGDGPISRSSTTARREVSKSLSRRLRAIPPRPEMPSRSTSPAGNPTAAFRRLKAMIWVACPLAVVAISFWMARADGRGTTGRTGAQGVERTGGICPCRGLGRMPDRHGHLVLAGSSGQRVFPGGARAQPATRCCRGGGTKSFCTPCVFLRPGLFDRSATAGLPRLFTVCFDKEGALLLGGHTQPFSRRSISLAACAPDSRQNRPSAAASPSEVDGQRVVLMVRKDGADVELTFPLERAKVAWTSRTFLEADPVKAALALVEGLRNLSSLEGPGICAARDAENDPGD